MEYWYDWPLQCRYLSKGFYREGIVYQDFVIDLSTGVPLKIKDIYSDAEHYSIDIDDAIIEREWSRLSYNS